MKFTDFNLPGFYPSVEPDLRLTGMLSDQTSAAPIGTLAFLRLARSTRLS